jgi:hypothetical protein
MARATETWAPGSGASGGGARAWLESLRAVKRPPAFVRRPSCGWLAGGRAGECWGRRSCRGRAGAGSGRRTGGRDALQPLRRGGPLRVARKGHLNGRLRRRCASATRRGGRTARLQPRAREVLSEREVRGHASSETGAVATGCRESASAHTALPKDE